MSGRLGTRVHHQTDPSVMGTIHWHRVRTAISGRGSPTRMSEDQALASQEPRSTQTPCSESHWCTDTKMSGHAAAAISSAH